MRASVFNELAQTFHDGWPREEFAENVDFAAQFFRRQRLDEALRGGGSRAIEFCRLRGSRAREAQGFAFRGDLAHEAHRKSLCGIDAAPGEQKIAHHGVADIALQPRNSAEAGDKSEPQFRKAESAPSCPR